MGQVSQRWEEKTNLRADEVCKALVRMPLMTYVQIARLLSISPQQARNLVKHAWDRLCEQPYHSKHRSSKFVVGSHRLKVMVKLTEEAQKMWSEQERIISRSQVRPKDIDRVLSVMDILVELRWKGVLYDKWDMMLPQTTSEGLHAWLVRSDGYKMGMYLLPTRYDEIEFAKRAVILRGIIRRVTQHIGVSDTLFLVPTQQYENTLRIMTKLKNDGQSLFLLPLEVFLTDPEWYLNAIADRERHGIQALWPLLDIQDTFTFTAQYQYAALCKFGPRLYRFIDVYSNGSIDRVRAWQSAENAFAYQIPGTGEAATAWVYVYDQTMAEALVKIIGERDIITEFYPWPNAVHATSSKPFEPLLSKLDGWSLFDST
ncbi:hypothetical protein LLE49_23420 [Alicyclobacillus tolerans]|uniref:hypothetical protein n=1 Tax=Alicyclobacillus tolerans TaxID=90970 RepID=UPI001F22A4B3|nr:hypothetical protein [Alicyclobacillus tolerans]MCF8567674.1 hypothetical protein [Alicyclobacillus tolerans]